MSLVSPLLSVIVLVATVRVSAYENSCIQKYIGPPAYYDYVNEGFTNLSYGNHPKIYIPDGDCSPDKFVGVHLNVCNNNSNRTQTAHIIGPPVGQVTPVNITCHDPDGCRVFFVVLCKRK